MEYTELTARRCRQMNPSAIRELLKSLSTPGMISFAGGMPAAESFPLDTIKMLIDKVLCEKGAAVLQYGITEGYPPLREALSEYVKERGIRCTAAELCISTGAQSAIDAAAKVLVDPGDVVAVESPTFLAALNVFKNYEAQLAGIASDDEGIIPEHFEEVLKERRVKLAYIIPTFQNPSGRTLSLPRRKAVLDIAARYGTLILEDDPYFELRYSGETLPTLKSMAPDQVIYVGSLSKVLSPGLRLGYYIAPGRLQDLMTTTRQAVDVHANHLAQAAAAEYVAAGHLHKQLPKIIDLYRLRLQVMLEGLSSLPDGFVWSRPEGGMFVWAAGPADFLASGAQPEALARKVAYVAGTHFFPEPGQGLNTLRLNFTAVSEDAIRRGLAVLAEVFRQAAA